MPLRHGLLSFLLVTLVAAAALLWRYQDNPHQSLENVLNTLVAKEIFTPPPLRGVLDRPGGDLTIDGVLSATNLHRQNNGAGALKINPTLNQAAANKLSDMFAQQYFEHESPQGQGPADVVEAVAYSYLRVGENLALGNYNDDAGLVQAWMDSPGHRRNLLDDGFTDIGIAVAPGQFEGQQTWLAVQTFALPASACPNSNQQLQTQFDQQSTKLSSTQSDLDSQLIKLDQTKAELATLDETIEQLREDANSKLAAGNASIEEGNRIAEAGDNEAAQPDWDTGEELQQAAQTLFDQARAKQDSRDSLFNDLVTDRESYNTDVNSINNLQKETSDLVDRLNQSINAYNDCLNSFSS